MDTTFKMEDSYISMIKGDTLSFGLNIVDDTGVPVDLDAVTFTCKNSKSNIKNVFQKVLGDGITRKNPGVYVVRVAPTDTETAESGKYFYDLEIRKGVDVYTLKHGILEIIEDISKGV